ncbi:hypothetical protein D3C80_671600 [compost metagenome]
MAAWCSSMVSRLMLGNRLSSSSSCEVLPRNRVRLSARTRAPKNAGSRLGKCSMATSSSCRRRYDWPCSCCSQNWSIADAIRCLSASAAWVNGLLELDAWAQPSIASRICRRSSRMRASCSESAAGWSVVIPEVSTCSFSNKRCRWDSLILLPSSEITGGVVSMSAS